jgi:hypothetical protein
VIGTNTFSGGFSSDCGTGISLGAIAPARPAWMEQILTAARQHSSFRATDA